MSGFLPSHGGLVVLGGRSEIGGATACRLCSGRPVIIAQRPSSVDVGIEADLRAAGATEVFTLEWDANRHDDLTEVYTMAEALCGQPITTVIVAFGVLGSQDHAVVDPDEAYRTTYTDYVAQVVTITAALSYLREQSEGLLIAFSSIAGWRVRKGNFVYGSAKAGLDGYLSGLIDATHGESVKVVMARPGFVIGRMTEGMSPTIMSSTADSVADAVARAVHRGRHRVWIPRRLAFLAAIMPIVPQWVWRQLPR